MIILGLSVVINIWGHVLLYIIYSIIFKEEYIIDITKKLSNVIFNLIVMLTLICVLSSHVFSSCSSDTLDQAVEIEHEIFRASKSANLYKASVLKRVSVTNARLRGNLISFKTNYL